jgi:uncharacterized protein YggE
MRSMIFSFTTAMCVCAMCLPALAQSISPLQVPVAPWTPSITVSGVGEVQVAPNMATVTVGVVTDAITAGEAEQNNNKTSEALFKALRQQGVAEDDIKTTGFYLSPRYAYAQSGEKPPRIEGYSVVNQVSVKVRDLSELGKLLDTAVAAGANQIQAVSFSNSDPAFYMNEARRLAIEDAKRRAALYAAAIDANLHVPPLIQEEQLATSQPITFAQERAMAGAAAVPVAPGRQTYSAKVIATYEIGETRR